MPSFTYDYLDRATVGVPGAETCAAGTIGAALDFVGPYSPTWAELAGAANAVAVSVGPPWDLREARWRAFSFRLGLNPFAGGAPGAPLAPSPLVVQMDATEKGQLSYHVGTAAGLALAWTALAPGGGAEWWEYHLSRFLNAGGQCNFAGALRPDLVLLSVTPLVAGATLNYCAVWECKGHAINAGPTKLRKGLRQALALTGVTVLPGNIALPGPIAPVAKVASKVDVYYGNYRLQVVDPGDPPNDPIKLDTGQAAAFYRSYYTSRAGVIRESGAKTRAYDGIDFVTTELIPGYWMGLEERIFTALAKSDAELVETVCEVVRKGFANKDPERVWVSRTGFSLELGDEWFGYVRQPSGERKRRRRDEEE